MGYNSHGMKYSLRRILLLLLFALYGCAGSVSADDPAAAPSAYITVKGSDTMVILAQKWAEVYMKTNPGTSIQVTGGGSGVGISALINGATDIANASRKMKATEKDILKQLNEESNFKV
jgi:ABC-type phosphate transport system substrate-binding protein